MKPFKVFPFRSEEVGRTGANGEAGVERDLGEKELCIDNLLVRIHFIIEMIWWTDLAP